MRGKRDLPRAAIRKLLRRIKSGRVPEPIPEVPEIESRRLDFARAHELMGDARAVCEAAIEAARARVSEALRAAARDPRFRLALAWQNRGALRDGVDVLLRAPQGQRNQRVRKHEATVALYLQRYCAKNDTIGFFGPMGWGRIVGEGPALVTEPGPDLVAHRERATLRVGDVVLAIGTRLHFPQMHWGLDDDLKIVRIDIDPVEQNRFAPPAAAASESTIRIRCAPWGAPVSSSRPASEPIARATPPAAPRAAAGGAQPPPAAGGWKR